MYFAELIDGCPISLDILHISAIGCDFFHTMGTEAGVGSPLRGTLLTILARYEANTADDGNKSPEGVNLRAMTPDSL